MKKVTFLVTILAITLHSFGQDTMLLKRTPYRLTLKVDKNSDYEEDIKETPFVLPDKTVQIYPGETIYVEVHVDNGKIVSMTAVKEIKDPTITLTIKMTQSVKRKVHELTMLEIHNPFPRQLIYKATMFLLRQRKWVNTDVLPIEPALSMFETWPDIIISLGLGDWKFATN